MRISKKCILVICISAVVLGLVAVAATCAAPTKTEMVPMRDGTKLVTDIYLPAGGGKYPTVLMRSPYPRNDGEGFVKLGFACVVQSTRGRYGSEGKNLAFLDDGWARNQDGYDTVEWIAKQPWSNGDVGTFGGSALGITQYMMAGSAPPHLRCQAVLMAGGNLCDPIFYQGGAFRKEMIENWTAANKFDPEFLQTVKAHPSYDSFCKSHDLSTRYDKVNFPILHVGGWYDIFQQANIDAFTGIQAHGGEGARGNQKLIIGPWVHGGQEQAGDFKYPHSIDVNAGADSLEWLNHWLKGADNAAAKLPAVTYYTMGAVGEAGAPGNVWRSADSWPVPAKATPYYLHANGYLDTQRPSDRKSSKAYVFDPDNPVPTIGGDNLTIPAGPRDQRPAESRPDVLIFTSDPLTQPLEVTGRITVKLWASSSAKDTDFTAKITDVYPDGRSMLLCDGIARARYRNSLSRPQMMEPGKPYEFGIDLWSTSMIFSKGHRIRLAISSSNSPRFDVNPNTGEPIFDAKTKIKARNTVYLDHTHPSAVLLPIVSSGK